MRTPFSPLATLLLAATLLTLTSAPALAAEKAKLPNIVLLISDDQGWTDYGFVGSKNVSTPNLDKLAATSRTYLRGYVPTALCRASLSTMATGLYAHQDGITGNDPSPKTPENRLKMIARHDKLPSLAKILGKAGYVSHQSGKWWEGSYKRGGFDEGMTQGFPKPGGRHGDAGLEIGRKTMTPVTEFIDKAVKEEKPFLVWFAPFLPHAPHNPPERIFKKYKGKHPGGIAKYYAMCEWFDETCGTLLNHLEEKGVADNTLILYVCDNGWIPTERGRYAPRSKRTPYEGGVRTPIMVRWKAGGVEPAIDKKTLVSSIDLLPTVLAATGLQYPAAKSPVKKLPGISLLNDARGEEAICADRVLFGESFAHDQKLDNLFQTLQHRWCIQGDWKLLLSYPNGGAGQSPKFTAELFNLTEDPAEKVDLAKENRKKVKELQKKIDAWVQNSTPYTTKSL